MICILFIIFILLLFLSYCYFYLIIICILFIIKAETTNNEVPRLKQKDEQLCELTSGREGVLRPNIQLYAAQIVVAVYKLVQGLFRVRCLLHVVNLRVEKLEVCDKFATSLRQVCDKFNQLCAIT